jgi:hypothetical protein
LRVNFIVDGDARIGKPAQASNGQSHHHPKPIVVEKPPSMAVVDATTLEVLSHSPDGGPQRGRLERIRHGSQVNTTIVNGIGDMSILVFEVYM